LECAAGAVRLIAETSREKDFAYLHKFVSGADEERDRAVRSFERVRRKGKKRGEGDSLPAPLFILRQVITERREEHVVDAVWS
jgi:hypothetical protein